MSAQWRPLSYVTQFMLSDPSIRVHAAGAKCDKNTDQLPRRTHQHSKHTQRQLTKKPNGTSQTHGTKNAMICVYMHTVE